MCGENVEGDAKQIGSKCSARLIPLRRPQHGEKSFLGQFLGLRSIVHAAPEKPVDPLAVAQEKFGEGCVRALLKFQDQLLITSHRSSRARIHAFPSGASSGLKASISVMSRERRKFPRLQPFSAEARTKGRTDYAPIAERKATARDSVQWRTSSSRSASTITRASGSVPE